jgi:uncharacterized protein (DUF983 family)
MLQLLRIVFDGLILRCPHCHTGKMFTSWFKMRAVCPNCGTHFERATGEITGGMAVNTVTTLFLVIIASVVIGFSTIPLIPALITVGIAIFVFPIVFYPFSRGLWVAFLYMTGNNHENS